MTHRTLEQLETGLDAIRSAPALDGRLELIVRRPEVEAREELVEATLDPEVGLVGDNWLARGNRHMPDGGADPTCQLTLMSTRAIDLIAGVRDRWALAGDQLYVDLDLSEGSLPAGTRVRIGTALLEISATPHTGCAKFATRFGRDAVRFVNTPAGRSLRLRGLNAVVVEAGTIRLGDAVRPCHQDVKP